MWTINNASDTYNISHWGEKYFAINAEGRVVVRPYADESTGVIDLFAVVQNLRQQDISTPMLLRFPNILHHRIDSLSRAFSEAKNTYAYQGDYTAVYPIKVNQQYRVVKEIVEYGDRRVGLEAGSKSELLIVLALAKRKKNIVICNGYKDRDYVRLALLGLKLGLQVYLVVEKMTELDLILEESKKLQVVPLLGLRIRLATLGVGKWQNSGGEKSKFGLSSSQVIEVISRLKQSELLAGLQLLHFHLGSQLPNIHDIQKGLREGTRFFAELHKMGATIQCVDVGGGLGIDYEGSRSRRFCSINYTIQEYANNIVQALSETCTELKIPHPCIITESGRAMTAHHAVLITDVVEVEKYASEIGDLPESILQNQVIQNLLQARFELTNYRQRVGIFRSPVEIYHEAIRCISEAHSLFIHGLFSLQHRSIAERIYSCLCRDLLFTLNTANKTHRDIIDELNDKLADKYICNFSIFQSLPDVWALKQIFPIVPVHRLDEEPTRRGTVQDLTCDSDGRIDNYVDKEGVESNLPMHDINPGQQYLLGVFLVGAYQETLGDMHNLFGTTNSANVELLDGQVVISEVKKGDNVRSVLESVNFNCEDLKGVFNEKIKETNLSDAEQKEIFLEIVTGMDGYTYFER